MPKEDPSKLQRAQGEEQEQVPLSVVGRIGTDAGAVVLVVRCHLSHSRL